VRRIGQYSYTLYLVHFVIIKALVLNGVADWNMSFFVAIAALLSILFSAAVFEFVEKPLKPLRQRLSGH
jgi:peptidoglycan/LPS O-acetylase OafA/YrhL